MIVYTTQLRTMTPDHLIGFFVGWRHPRSPQDLLRILRSSDRIVLAIDDGTGHVIGFVNALTDGVQSAFIPLLEVLPEYQGHGIGKELVSRMIALLDDVPCIDLACDPEVQPFYERCGMVRSVGMSLRRHPAGDIL